MMTKEDVRATRKLWRESQGLLHEGSVEANLHVWIASSFTVESLVPFFGGELVRKGYRPDIGLAPYGQIYQTCIDPGPVLGRGSDLDALIILWRIEDILAPELAACLVGDLTSIEKAKAKIDELMVALSSFKAGRKGLLIINIPPYPETVESDILDLGSPQHLGTFHRDILEHFCSRARSISGLGLFDLDGIQRAFGMNSAADSRKWYLYHQPYTDEYLACVGYHLSRYLDANLVASPKCAVLDCDNTLWGGVVGEDGLGGIALGDDFPGSAYQDFQRLLTHWESQGVFLALLSKNNESDVFEVFDKHDGMILKRRNISAWKINWEPKAHNIQAIAESLNIGLDSLVFFDDNPMEIEQMRELRPEVRCVRIPEDPAFILEAVRKVRPFERLSVTTEDRARTRMAHQERDRVALRQAMSEDDFLKELGLVVEVFQVRDEHLGRVTQLINKTNQFNLTTRRRTQDEVRLLLESTQHVVIGMRVADKFGEYGLTGLSILDFQDEKALLDTFLLSCRVLGRQVEHALLHCAAQEARRVGMDTLEAQFIPTAKNAPAADFLPDSGFQQRTGEVWTIPIKRVASPPKHIAIHGIARND